MILGRCQSQAIVTVYDIHVNPLLHLNEPFPQTYVDIRFFTLCVLTTSGGGIIQKWSQNYERMLRKTIPTMIGNEI